MMSNPTNTTTTSFYKRELPLTCIDYASSQGKELFKLALQDGKMEGYFRLASQFTTQSEPAFCGLGSLCMVLNSLGVDPMRLWRGSWRWYSEEMFDCCRPLEEIKKTGITLGEFGCLATCNGLTAKVYRADKISLDKFKMDIVRTSALEDEVIVASYDRKTLGQTGAGHFSPIGGYCAERNMVLLLDVARFKYPPHWVSLDLLWEALHPLDLDTNKPRGYVVLKRRNAELMGSTLPKLSLTTVSIATLVQTLMEVKERIVDQSIPNLSIDTILIKLMGSIPESLNDLITERSMDDLQHTLTDSMQNLSTETVQQKGCSDVENQLHDQHRALVSLTQQYQKQLAQLVRRIHELPLCTKVCRLMRLGAARQRSVSLAQVPMVPEHNSPHSDLCHYCHPDDIDLTNSAEDLLSLGTNHAPALPRRQSDPKTPAFLTMLLLSIPTSVFLPQPTDPSSHCQPIVDQVRTLWNVDDAPLLVRSEIHLFRKQVNALVHTWRDEGDLLQLNEFNSDSSPVLNMSSDLAMSNPEMIDVTKITLATTSCLSVNNQQNDSKSNGGCCENRRGL